MSTYALIVRNEISGKHVVGEIVNQQRLLFDKQMLDYEYRHVFDILFDNNYGENVMLLNSEDKDDYPFLMQDLQEYLESIKDERLRKFVKEVIAIVENEAKEQNEIEIKFY